MQIFNALSTPLEGDFAALTAELATFVYRTFCLRAMRIAKTHGYDQDDRVVEITQQLAQRAATTAYWTPEVGVLFKALSKTTFTKCDWNWVRAQIALSAYLTGVRSELKIEIEANAPLVVAGQMLPAGRLVLQGGPDRLMVQVGSEASPRSFSVIGQRDSSPLWAEDGRASEFLMVDGKRAIRLVDDAWHVTWSDEITQPVAPVDQRAITQFQEALDLLGRAAPEYRDWVVCLLREITPIRSPADDAYSSGSSLWRFGGIDLSVPASPVQTAEMLVHECTHLYFLQASWTGPVVTPDAKPYYSPLKNCERPLDKILTSYHALGNQFIVLDKLRTRGFEKEVSDRLGTIASQLEQLLPPMENEAGLSDLGLAFSRPLRTRLAQGRRAA